MGPTPAVAAVRLAVRTALRRHARPGRPLVVACSGGADSLALAAAVAFEAPRSAHPAALVTVDHGLQAGSEEQARRVAQFGYDLGFEPVEVTVVQPGTAGGPEAAARAARFAALDAIAERLGSPGEPALVLLGHTQDDQAETVLLGLGRGSGIASLAGMRMLAGHYLRPLLGVRRVDTESVCADLGLPVWHDPHNVDPRFRRVRVRSELLPLMEEILGGGVSAALARTATQLRESEEALEAVTGSLLAAAIGTETATATANRSAAAELLVEPLAGAPDALRHRVLKRWVESCGAGPLSAAHVAELDGLITRWRGQGPIDLPTGSRVLRSSGRLQFIAPGIPPAPARTSRQPHATHQE